MQSTKGTPVSFKAIPTSTKSHFNGNWIIGAGIVSNHIIAVYTLLFYRDVAWPFLVGAVVAGYFNMLGITAGYHRLWSHHSFTACLPLRQFLSLLGSASWQGSIHWWVLRHRMHHRFVDTPFDPYDSTRGFWFSHFGWLFEKPAFYAKKNIIDMDDLKRDPVVEWNKRYTPHCVIGLGLILPTLIGHALGDATAGFLWLGVMGRIISWNGIFAVNSWAHMWGEREFNNKSSAASSFLCALVSNGEGNHSYHHEYARDYRHGVWWYQWDPTKWSIWIWSKLGLASNLVCVVPHLRQESMLQTKVELSQKWHQEATERLQAHRRTPDNEDMQVPLVPDPLSLPTTTLEEVRERFNSATYKDDKVTLVQIGKHLCDVTTYMHQHPGGKTLLQALHLKDATDMFMGGKNMHSRAAHNLVERLCIAFLTDTNGHRDSKYLHPDAATT